MGALALVGIALSAGCQSSEQLEEQERKEAEKDESFQRIMGRIPPEDAETKMYPYLSDLDGLVERSSGGGAVDVGISFTNASSQTIKYATFRITPYNAVGDPVGPTVHKMNRAELKYTGPLEPGQESGLVGRKRVWDSGNIVRYDIEWVTIEYMDGDDVDIAPLAPIRITD